jgi:hypothetical protein|tara:strand:+ start:7125 stop:7442 length:318 start_codon:yes stop_codon:yes gene_type:complete
MARFKKKPTIKEIANVVVDLGNYVNEINKKVNEAHMVLRQIDDILGLYIKFKNDMPKFRIFLDKMVEERTKEDDKETDGETNIADIQGHPENEGSGTEGVREATR